MEEGGRQAAWESVSLSLRVAERHGGAVEGGGRMRGMGEEKGKQGEEEGGSGGGGEVESYWRRGEEDAGMWTPTDDWLQITPGISGTHAATALSLVSPPSITPPPAPPASSQSKSSAQLHSDGGGGSHVSRSPRSPPLGHGCHYYYCLGVVIRGVPPPAPAALRCRLIKQRGEEEEEAARRNFAK